MRFANINIGYVMLYQNLICVIFFVFVVFYYFVVVDLHHLLIYLS